MRGHSGVLGTGIGVVAFCAFVHLLHQQRPSDSHQVHLVRSTPHRDSGSAPLKASARIPAASESIYVEGWCGTLRIWIDGEPQALDPGGATSLNACHAPLLLRAPRLEASTGASDLRFELVLPLVERGFLGDVYAGPREVMARQHRLRHLLKRVAPLSTASALLTLSVLALGLVATRRVDSEYGWFGAVTATLAAHSLMLLTYPGLAPEVWCQARRFILSLFVVFIVFLVHRLLGIERRRIERCVLVTQLALGSLMLTSASNSPATKVALAVTVAIGLYPSLLLRVATPSREKTELSVILSAGATLMIFGGHDLLLVTLGWFVPQGYYLPYGSPPVVGCLLWFFFERFRRALHSAQTLASELDLRVRRRELELERNYHALAVSERRRAMLAERERIMRDIHDGVGGNLAAALSCIEEADHGSASPQTTPAELRCMLQDSLDDLRNVMHTLSPEGASLNVLLAQLRMRTEPRLKARGVQLKWRIGQLPQTAAQSPDEMLHVLRIVQEAVNNAVQHSGCRTLEVRTGTCQAAPGGFVEVRDDGNGNLSGTGPGHGLRNMRCRAKAIEASLRLSSSPSGAVVHLALPSSRPSSTPPDSAWESSEPQRSPGTFANDQSSGTSPNQGPPVALPRQT